MATKIKADAISEEYTQKMMQYANIAPDIKIVIRGSRSENKGDYTKYIKFSHPWLEEFDNAELCLMKMNRNCKKLIKKIEGKSNIFIKNAGYKFRKVLPYKSTKLSSFMYEDIEENWTGSYTIGFKNKFAVAVRLRNPEFDKVVDPQRELSDSTQMINGVKRYFYSKIKIIEVNVIDDVGNYSLCIR